MEEAEAKRNSVIFLKDILTISKLQSLSLNPGGLGPEFMYLLSRCIWTSMLAQEPFPIEGRAAHLCLFPGHITSLSWREGTEVQAGVQGNPGNLYPSEFLYFEVLFGINWELTIHLKQILQL